MHSYIQGKSIIIFVLFRRPLGLFCFFFSYYFACLLLLVAVGCLAGVVSAAAASWHVLLAGWLVALAGSLGFWGACGPGRGFEFGVGTVGRAGVGMEMGLLRLRLGLGLNTACWLTGWLMAHGSRPDGGWLDCSLSQWQIADGSEGGGERESERKGEGSGQGQSGLCAAAVAARQRQQRQKQQQQRCDSQQQQQKQRRFALCSAEFSISVVS